MPPDWALQDPEDYLDVLRDAVPAAVSAAGIDPASVIGIATDFTASTPMPVLRDGTPLCRVPGFEGRPHAYPKLWKHHAAQGQADRVNAVAAERGEPWLARYGGRISSEWEFAKALQVLDEDPEVYERMERWVEGADWIVWQLCGAETRNACSAGLQGDPAGRPLSERRLPGRAGRALHELRGRQARRAHLPARRPRRCPDRRRPRRGQGCRPGSPSRSATSTRT